MLGKLRLITQENTVLTCRILTVQSRQQHFLITNTGVT